MIAILGEKTVRVRKPHICFGCGRTFGPPVLMDRSCVIDGSRAWTCYLCSTCAEIARCLPYDEEFGFKELREAALEKENETVEDEW